MPHPSPRNQPWFNVIPGFERQLVPVLRARIVALVERRTGVAREMVTENSEPVVFTAGHSTRPLAEFIALLKAHSVARLIDVRTVPRSRHNPQFDRDTLPAALAADGVGYEPRASASR